MASEWKEVHFSELCDITRGASPRPIHEWITDNGVPWVKISDATAASSRFIVKTRESIRSEGRSKSVAVAPGDLILSNSATPGIPMFVDIEACIHDGWLLLRNFRGLDKFFALYLLRHERPALVQQGNGSVFTNLKTEILKKHRVRIPPLEEQRSIASVLGSLDDKIELNRRINETLEEIARTIFKSWFVNFDPVRAKMEGRQPPGMDEETAALFPDSFEDSALGEIPKGWSITSIGEAVRTVGGGTPSTKEPAFWEGGTHCWATPRDLSKLQSPILLDTERKVTDAGVAKISSRLLPEGTVLLSSRAPVGYLAIAHVPVAVNQGFIAMVCDGSLTTHYVLHWARSRVEQIKGRAGGTTFQEISKKNFRPMLVLVPPSEVLSAFEAQVAPLYDKMSANLRQSSTLAAIRDALLPKLLSGEIRVREVE